MFQSLSDTLGGVFERLKKRATLTEADVDQALREVRVALLEADVALPVAKSFVKRVKERAVGQEVLRSVTPGQQVVKIVNDALVETLAGDPEEAARIKRDGPINLLAVPPVPILMVGLQGSGKTTTSAKLGYWLAGKQNNKKVLLASLDTRRPAAMEQLKVLGEQAGVDTLPIVPKQTPVQIAKRAMEAGRLGGYDAVVLDTAGRLAIDVDLMAEVEAIRDAVNPVETLLVCDAMTGQDAVTVADAFARQIGITGIVLTRIDGDARGGAALSMRAVTGQPIKLIGVGEKFDALEPFHADRIASRILGMGDVVSLVEKAAETMEAEDAEKLAKKLQKGKFDLEDMLGQLRQMSKMGGMSGLMGLMPGVGKIKEQMKAANVDDRVLKRQEAMILSMTPAERRNPEVIKASRKKRIAAGSGMQVQDVNKLLKQWQTMNDVLRQAKKMGKKGKGPRGLPPGFGGGPGGGLPPGLGGGGLPPGIGGGLPGLGGGGLPKLPGLPGKKGP